MASSTNTKDLVERYRKETFDEDSDAYVVDDVLALDFLQDAVARYSAHRPLYSKGTFTILDNVIDYAADAEMRRVTSLWDETDGADVAFQIDFEVVDIDGKKIRVVDALPEAGRVFTYYMTKNHARPTAAVTVGELLATIDDGDADLILDWMVIRWARMEARRLLSRAAAKGGKWKAGARSESYDQALKEAKTLATEMTEAWMTEMRKPFSLYGSAYPMEEHAGSRRTLTGAGKYQGTLGWSGYDDGKRRRGV